MKPLANNWLEFARKDLEVANQIASNAELTALTAFHCQQCIEELTAFPVDAATLREIDDTYMESRYPLS